MNRLFSLVRNVTTVLSSWDLGLKNPTPYYFWYSPRWRSSSRYPASPKFEVVSWEGDIYYLLFYYHKMTQIKYNTFLIKNKNERPMQNDPFLTSLTVDNLTLESISNHYNGEKRTDVSKRWNDAFVYSCVCIFHLFYVYYSSHSFVNFSICPFVNVLAIDNIDDLMTDDSNWRDQQLPK